MNKNSSIVFKLLLISAIFCVQPVQAEVFTIKRGSDIVGKMKTVTAEKGDTLYTIGRAHDMGIWEMQEANPKINAKKAIAAGTNVIVPSAYILPPGERSGMVINLAELRVYYFDPDGETVSTHPLGIGRTGWRTPVGETTIIRKRENPSWTPPASIRAEAENRGVELPAVVPAGPNNPLGDYAMNFGWNGYMMHGTNAPQSVGSRASHGCMRMYDEDIEDLFNRVEVGTKVRVIYEPFKVGTKDGQLYLEAHELFEDEYYTNVHDDRDELLNKTVAASNFSNGSQINWNEAIELIKQTHGYPVNITSTVSARPEQSL